MVRPSLAPPAVNQDAAPEDGLPHSRGEGFLPATVSPALRHKRLVIGLVALGLAIFSLVAISVYTRNLLYLWDSPVNAYFTGLRQQAAPWLTTVARFIGQAGSNGLTVVTIILLVVFALQRRMRYFLLLLASVGGVELLWLLLVFSIGRSRPVEVHTVFDIVLPSFPSGHAMINVAFFGTLLYLYFTRMRNPHLRRTVATATIVFLVLTGWVRLYFSVHYLTDVIAGYAAGLGWTAAALLGVDWFIYCWLPARTGRVAVSSSE